METALPNVAAKSFIACSAGFKNPVPKKASPILDEEAMTSGSVFPWTTATLSGETGTVTPSMRRTLNLFGFSPSKSVTESSTAPAE